MLRAEIYSTGRLSATFRPPAPQSPHGGNQENQAVTARVEHSASAHDRVDTHGFLDLDAGMAVVRAENHRRSGGNLGTIPANKDAIAAKRPTGSLRDPSIRAQPPFLLNQSLAPTPDVRPADPSPAIRPISPVAPPPQFVLVPVVPRPGAFLRPRINPLITRPTCSPKPQTPSPPPSFRRANPRVALNHRSISRLQPDFHP